MRGHNHNQACPSCGAPVEETVQHYVRIPELRDPLVHGEPGTNVLGHVEVLPCGCRIAPDATRGEVSS